MNFLRNFENGTENSDPTTLIWASSGLFQSDGFPVK